MDVNERGETTLMMSNLAAFPHLQGLMSDSVLRDEKVEALKLRDMLATEDGFKELRYDDTVNQAKRFQECFRVGSTEWLAINKIIANVERCKSTMTRVHFHEEISRLLTDRSAVNAAAHIRKNWSQCHTEEAKLPFSAEAMALKLLEKKDFSKRIDVKELSGTVSRDIFNKIKHHNFLCSQKVNKS